MHYGEKLLMTANPEIEKDQQLLQRLGIRIEGTTINDQMDEKICEPIRA